MIMNRIFIYFSNSYKIFSGFQNNIDLIFSKNEIYDNYGNLYTTIKVTFDIKNKPNFVNFYN